MVRHSAIRDHLGRTLALHSTPHELRELRVAVDDADFTPVVAVPLVFDWPIGAGRFEEALALSIVGPLANRHGAGLWSSLEKRRDARRFRAG